MNEKNVLTDFTPMILNRSFAPKVSKIAWINPSSAPTINADDTDGMYFRLHSDLNRFAHALGMQDLVHAVLPESENDNRRELQGCNLIYNEKIIIDTKLV